MEDRIKRSNIYLIRDPDGANRENQIKEIYE